MKILCFSGYYLPSYKAGGPVKTIFNMVEQLPEFEFSIVTRDRDLGDVNCFENAMIDQWQRVGNADVFYVSDNRQSLSIISEIVNVSDFNVLYLNSYFDFKFSIKPLLAVKIKLIKQCPIVLAPRGEFSKGALAIKPFKKKLYIKISSLLGLYKKVIWQASSEYEKQDIIDALSVNPDSIFVAKDLPAKRTDVSTISSTSCSDNLRIVFLSRISPKKNLDFALRILASVKSKVIFDIYGPTEDQEYWDVCADLIKNLSDNITVSYCGSIKPEQVKEIFSNYDLFFFPTRGENYGHVIAESLSVGTPVLISDQTPWQKLSDDELGWDLPLDSKELFVEKIELLASMPLDERLFSRKIVLKNGFARVNNEGDILDNKKLFEFAFQKFNENKV